MKRTICAALCMLLCILFCLQLVSCGESGTDEPLTPEQKEATQITKENNEAVYTALDFGDKDEFACAQKGLIAAPEALELKDENGKVIWSQKAYSFVENNAQAPATVNPSLWRDTQLNHIYGLFEVSDGIYQVRGYDMSNMTLVEGKTGWIVFDPLMSMECSKAAMQLVEEHLGKRPVTGIVISHPHVDHYGGIKGIVSEEEVTDRKIPIIVPEGFEEHAISENVYAGNAMGRRANYQYGTLLQSSPQGTLAMGIGMGQSKGTITYITPNDIIKETGEKRTVDGVAMEFQMTPGTEAPAEMNTWFPQKNALWLAENCTGTLHNLYTLRGAQVRDGNAWAEYIMEAVSRYGTKVETVFQSHNWPHWENAKIRKYMVDTAAVYKFINDQTLMYLNQGLTENEIANKIKLPAELEKNWYTRQYYGTVAHNAKAVYQRFMGWYDANPVHLGALDPSESAKKYVEYLGDTGAVLKKAKEDFDKGEYQWVAEITNVLVYADPENKEARYLCADALEQLGYQAESGAWRNAYLAAAYELRNGTGSYPQVSSIGAGTTAQGMDAQTMLDYMGIMLDTEKLADTSFTIRLKLTDGEDYFLKLHHGVLLYYKDDGTAEADLTLSTVRTGILAIANSDQENIAKLVTTESGDMTLFEDLCTSMTTPELYFNIIEP